MGRAVRVSGGGAAGERRYLPTPPLRHVRYWPSVVPFWALTQSVPRSQAILCDLADVIFRISRGLERVPRQVCLRFQSPRCHLRQRRCHLWAQR